MIEGPVKTYLTTIAQRKSTERAIELRSQYPIRLLLRENDQPIRFIATPFTKADRSLPTIVILPEALHYPDQWSNSVDVLRNIFPEVQIIGLTLTDLNRRDRASDAIMAIDAINPNRENKNIIFLSMSIGGVLAQQIADDSRFADKIDGMGLIATFRPDSKVFARPRYRFMQWLKKHPRVRNRLLETAVARTKPEALTQSQDLAKMIDEERLDATLADVRKLLRTETLDRRTVAELQKFMNLALEITSDARIPKRHRTHKYDRPSKLDVLIMHSPKDKVAPLKESGLNEHYPNSRKVALIGKHGHADAYFTEGSQVIPEFAAFVAGILHRKYNYSR